METLVISLGGSIIVPDRPDYFFLREFKNFIINNIEKYNFIIVCGGGKTNKYYNLAATRISNVDKDDLDWIGIMASRLNAELVRTIFGKLAYKKVIYNPNKKINHKITIAAGWKPGWSTDYDAVLLAKTNNAQRVINLTNVTHVYNKNPKFQDAQKLYEISWKDYRKIIGKKWSPRLSTPFDPVASKEAQKLKLKVVILKGSDLNNFKNYLLDKGFEGTIIK